MAKTYSAFVTVKNTDTGRWSWRKCPGVFPADGDDPSDAPEVIAAAFAQRMRLEPGQEYDFRIYEGNGLPVRLGAKQTTSYKKIL